MYSCRKCGKEMDKDYDYCDDCIGFYCNEDGPQYEPFERR